jgi:hypothetical protein
VTKEQVSRGSSQIEEQSHWSDKHSTIPNKLGLAGVPAEVVGLYVKMKLVGTETRPGLQHLQTRCCWGRDKLKRWQRTAWELGWIMLLSEGRAAGDGKTAHPRHWWLCDVPYELPPQDLVSRVLESRTLPPQPEKWTRVLKSSRLDSSNLVSRTQTSSLSSSQQVPKKTKREKADSPPLSSAAPTKGQEALAQMNPAFRAKHGVDLEPDCVDQAAQALAVYGADLVPSWQAYLDDDGTRGRMLAMRHPIPIFTSQPQSWRRSASAAADPAKRAAAEAAAARAKAEQQARTEASYDQAERLVARWPNLPAQLRAQLLDQVAAMSGFMAEFVKGCRQKHGGNFPAGSAICSAILELRPDLVAGGQHG